MIELARAVDALVAAATSQVDPRTLKSVVENVLDGFGPAKRSEQDAALRKIGRALGKVDGRGAQILSLALGALVEGGASPELAWPAVSQDLAGLLERATAFASAVVKRAKDHHLDAAIEHSGAAVAKKMPLEAEAWKATPSRCLAAVACLTRSKKLRTRARKDKPLEAACWPLSDAIAEVGYLLQALRIVDDEKLLVLAPASSRGWRIEVDAMPSNAELYILLADLLVGDPRKGRLPGKRPDPKAVAAVREGAPPPKGVSSVAVPFDLLTWTALAADGSLPEVDHEDTEHAVSIDGIPADIPLAPGKIRVALVHEAADAHPVQVAPSFESLHPTARIVAELSAGEVERMLLKLGKAAAKTRSEEPPPAKRTAPAKKKSTAKKTKRRPKA